jgi:predicted transcriptional regulator
MEKVFLFFYIKFRKNLLIFIIIGIRYIMTNIKKTERKKNKPGAGRVAVISEEIVRQLMPKSFGNVSNIARQLNVTPSALYMFLSDKPELKAEIRAFKEEFHDEVEDIIEELIRSRNVPIIMFYARTQMRNRGYNERVEITDANGNQLQQPLTINYILPPLPKGTKEYDPYKEVMPHYQNHKNIIQEYKREKENDSKSQD